MKSPFVTAHSWLFTTQPELSSGESNIAVSHIVNVNFMYSCTLNILKYFSVIVILKSQHVDTLL